VLYRGYALELWGKHCKKILASLLRVGSYCWDGILFLIFCIVSGTLLDIQGPSLLTYLVIGMIYIVSLGRRAIFSSQGIFSLAIIPCAIPALFFCVLILPSLRSDCMTSIAALIWVLFSRWPLFVPCSRESIAYGHVIKKIFLFITLQGVYGVGLKYFHPLLLEPLEWAVTPISLKPDHIYPTKSKIHFFYEDKEEADKIEVHLSEVMQKLESSPLYDPTSPLILVQKNKCIGLPLSATELSDLQGCFYPIKGFSYIFREFFQVNHNEKIYYAHNNPYRAVVLHELSHQMVSHYYGKWCTVLLIEKWKNEGYAEYMVATGYYSKKAALLAIVEEGSLSNEILAEPFSIKKSSDQYEIEDYMAAFLQTRYALDVKHISPIDFFKNDYKIASAQEIKEWLMKPEAGEAE